MQARTVQTKNRPATKPTGELKHKIATDGSVKILKHSTEEKATMFKSSCPESITVQSQSRTVEFTQGEASKASKFKPIVRHTPVTYKDVTTLKFSDAEKAVMYKNLESAWELKKHNLPSDFLTVPIKEISNIPFKGQKIQARLLNVVDGDTVSVAIFCGHMLKIKIRLAGIDTPELHPKCEDLVGEARAAQKVKDYVTSLLTLDSLVTIRLDKLDKYGGRYVGHIYLSAEETLSEHLLNRKYAKKYDGRAKPPWIASDFSAINGHERR